MKWFTLFLTVGAVSASNVSQILPDIADISHASRQAAELFHGYFTDKSLLSFSVLTYFSPTQTAYFDATLGRAYRNRTAVVALWEGLFKSAAPPSMNTFSYPLRIVGSTNSAVVHFVDRQGLFGAEIHLISAVDFLDGKIVRQVDYWDGRDNSVIIGRPPISQYPHDMGLGVIQETADRTIQKVAQKFHTTLVASDINSTISLFAYDAVLEDLTLRARLDGKLTIGRYLQRVWNQVPYGKGSTLTHVLGSVQGGGFEWETDLQTVPAGITSLQLDKDGFITQLTTTWDASRMGNWRMYNLARLSLEP